MLKDRKLTLMIEVLCFLLWELYPKGMLVEASIRNSRQKLLISNEDHSSNQISVDAEEKLIAEDQQLYYLPTQTMFAVTEAAAGGFSTTSPPHLTINPAPIKTSYQHSTISTHEDSSEEEEYHNDFFPSHCVSETPAVELKSDFLLPSQSLLKESVIMSGHLEIASKTSTIEDKSEINNVVSRPSIALQGTVLHPHTASDL